MERSGIKYSRLYYLMPLFAGIFWGTSGPFVRYFTGQHWDNMTVLFSRMSFAVVVMALLMLLFRRDLFRIHLRDVWLFILNGAVFTLGLNICYQESINRLTLSLAAVLLGMSPVFVLLLARIFFREKITAVKIGSMFLAIFGCILVSGVLEQSPAGHVTPVSIMIGLASAVCYSMQSIIGRMAADKGYNAITTTFYSLASVFIVTMPLADHAAIRTYAAAAPVSHIFLLILQAICVSILPALLYNASLARVETGRAAILAAAGEPSAATVFGAVIYKEIPSVLSLAGLAVVIIALSIICRPAKTADSEAL